jgi:hypothetical protein
MDEAGYAVSVTYEEKFFYYVYLLTVMHCCMTRGQLL